MEFLYGITWNCIKDTWMHVIEYCCGDDSIHDYAKYQDNCKYSEHELVVYVVEGRWLQDKR